MKNKHSLVWYTLVLLAAAIYLTLTLAAPINTSTPELEAYTTRIKHVRIALSVGYIISWLAAAYALAHLGKYIRFIAGSQEARGFKEMYCGLALLLIGFLIWPSTSAVRALFLDHEAWVRTATMVFNFMMIYPTLAGFFFLYKGSRSLLTSAQITSRISARSWLITASLLALIPLDIWLIFTNAQRAIPPAPYVPATFYLSDPFIILFIIIPSVVSWIFGVKAANRLHALGEGSSGAIYKKMLGGFCGGPRAVIIGSATLQVIVSAGTSKLFSLGPIITVLVVYTFVTMLALGNTLIARSTKELTKIETL